MKEILGALLFLYIIFAAVIGTYFIYIEIKGDGSNNWKPSDWEQKEELRYERTLSTPWFRKQPSP